MEGVIHGMRVGVRVGGVRRLRVVVGGVSQRRVVASVSSPLSPSGRGGPLCSLSGPSFCGQTGLVRGGPVRLGDDNVGILEESSGAQAVVVHGLGVGLQVALHVLWVEGEVGAQHG